MKTVAELLKEIESTASRLDEAEEDRRRSHNLQLQLECELANLRCEFTRAVAPHIDRATFDSFRPPIQEAVE